eukprot:CAMPEP_0198732422 /NCGR_PEP_ID=MMETSP1475-20131203/35835_1 /TAXON_ID= ORGANISM="Unidentified sp., Strain CCMP1999" /NCGR_SAMPLE_ID=MMETSP1475 /ASSEMBLY_ACC=CAM_ASM_001111 /LENGTH=284 /DNA_ID=CAMNT_0044495535 /DNA_START=20 /DNA_END=871 /DNA_ORIENTATION=-
MATLPVTQGGEMRSLRHDVEWGPWKPNGRKLRNALVSFVGVTAALFIIYVAALRHFMRTEDRIYKDVPSPIFTGDMVQHDVRFQYGTVHYASHLQENSNVHVFAIHGAAENLMSSRHWEPNLGLFQQLGSFHIIDLPGFGASTVNKKVQSIPRTLAAIGVERVMEDVGALQSDAKLVFVVRGWGAEALMMLFRRNEKIARRNVTLIMIAPSPDTIEMDETQKNLIRRMKGVVVWAEQDPVTPSTFAKIIEKYFASTQLLLLPHLATHRPETELPGIFASHILNW